jgi:hypothetical protein
MVLKSFLIVNISQVYFKFRVTAEVESMCKIRSDAPLLSLLLCGSRRDFPISYAGVLAFKNNQNTNKYLAK